MCGCRSRLCGCALGCSAEQRTDRAVQPPSPEALTLHADAVIVVISDIFSASPIRASTDAVNAICRPSLRLGCPFRKVWRSRQAELDITGSLLESSSLEDYGISGIPHAFVVDRKGKIAWYGHPAEPEMEKAVASALETAKVDK